MHVALQPPLSRCGHGPGVILLRPSCHIECQQNNNSLDPEPLQKWAEESYAVTQITLDLQSSSDRTSVLALIKEAEDRVSALPQCDSKDKFGLIGEFGTQTTINLSMALYGC